MPDSFWFHPLDIIGASVQVGSCDHDQVTTDEDKDAEIDKNKDCEAVIMSGEAMGTKYWIQRECAAIGQFVYIKNTALTQFCELEVWGITSE